MAATGVVGTRVYTSLTAMTNIEAAADAVGDFTGLTITTELGLIENVGEFGRVFETVPFVDVATGRTYKLKGAYNDGTLELVVAQDFSDTGQSTLKGYAEAVNQNNYPFKLTFTGADSSYDTAYFAAKVMSCRTQLGGANEKIRAMLRLEINSPIFFA